MGDVCDRKKPFLETLIMSSSKEKNSEIKSIYNQSGETSNF